MKQKILAWFAGIDDDHKEVLKTGGETIAGLLDLSSRVLFQLPSEKDNALVQGVKYVALVDSVYKSLIKREVDSEEERLNGDGEDDE